MSETTVSSPKRRSLEYATPEDVLRDAEFLASGAYSRAGAWSLGQVLQHVSAVIDASIDGFPMLAPAPLRFFARLLLKNRFLTRSTPAGFKIPQKMRAQVEPSEDITDAAGIGLLTVAITRLANEEPRAFHPILGQLTPDEWIRFHLRHCELHMSHIVPA